MNPTLKIILLAVLIVIAKPVAAQDCGCAEQFIQVKTFVEKNYSGFRDKITSDKAETYRRFSDSVLSRAREERKQNPCFALINGWVNSFNEGHMHLNRRYPQIDQNDSAAVDSVSRLGEVISIDDTKLGKLHGLTNPDTVEGIYYYRDSSYIVAVVKNQTPTRDYAGVLLASKTKFWRRDRVKFELKKTADDTFDVTFYYRDHHPEELSWAYQKGVFNNGEWLKEGIAFKQEPTGSPTQDQINQYPEARRVSENTFYIKIPSFLETFYGAIDSLVKANDSLLRSTPNLIIDVRNNGGGSDICYNPLLPYLYGNPIINTGVDVLATPENISTWAVLAADTQYTANTREEVRKTVAMMKEHEGNFVNIAPDDTTRFSEVLRFPRKVAILMNERCASATEQFLIAARQSTKVTLMGQHSHGVLDYSNVRNWTFPCGHLILSYPTTRSRRLPGGAIDRVGIAPVKLIPTQTVDWIATARMELEGK